MNQTYAVRVKRLPLRFLLEQFRNPSKTHFCVVHARGLPVLDSGKATIAVFNICMDKNVFKLKR